MRKFSGCGTVSVIIVAYSPDGKHVLSGSEDGEIRMRGAEDSERLPKILIGHTVLFLFPAFRSLSGTRFVSWSNERTICVWDAEGGLTDSNLRLRS